VRVLPIASLLAMSIGCYSPALRDCEITCIGDVCPSGFSCVEGVCRIDGHAGTCTTTLADAGDGDAPLFDGRQPDAASCSHVCYAPSGAIASQRGTAECRANGCTTYGWLDDIDFCTCSTASTPELYVKPTTADRANVAFAAKALPVDELLFLRSSVSSVCMQGTLACSGPSAGSCGDGTVHAWHNVLTTTDGYFITLYTSSSCAQEFARFEVK
jgi:hypothetical protein